VAEILNRVTYYLKFSFSEKEHKKVKDCVARFGFNGDSNPVQKAIICKVTEPQGLNNIEGQKTRVLNAHCALNNKIYLTYKDFFWLSQIVKAMWRRYFAKQHLN
jgi:hypothetical protein